MLIRSARMAVLASIPVTALVAVMSLSAVPAWAVSEADKAANCAATADIVREAVAQRVAGQSSEQAQGFLTSDEAGVDDKFDSAIPMLVDWVYTLDEAHLTEDAAKAMETQCLEFKS